MNEKPVGIVFDTSDVKIGTTKVRVYRKEENERTKKTVTKLVHAGVVLAKTTAFLTVFCSLPVDKGGDISPEMSQSYPAHGKLAWCEFAGEASFPHRVPALFQ